MSRATQCLLILADDLLEFFCVLLHAPPNGPMVTCPGTFEIVSRLSSGSACSGQVDRLDLKSASACEGFMVRSCGPTHVVMRRLRYETEQ
jgi:hypothetical protein